MISFHRGQTGTARRHLAAAVPHAERIGHRLIGPLALARSLDRERDGALPEAIAVLTAAFDGTTEETRGDRGLAGRRRPPRRAGRRPGRRPDRRGPRRRARRRLGHPAPAGERALLPRAARPRCPSAAGRRGPLPRFQQALPRAMALEAAAAEFIRIGDHRRARDAFTRAEEVYTSLGASHDVSRIQATFHAHGHPARSLRAAGGRRGTCRGPGNNSGGPLFAAARH